MATRARSPKVAKNPDTDPIYSQAQLIAIEAADR
jgi:hypothetical protein